jgi:hypothetical protein
LIDHLAGSFLENTGFSSALVTALSARLAQVAGLRSNQLKMPPRNQLKNKAVLSGSGQTN